ncbi:thiamine pyrophosphate-dependent enzyme, partial [Salmonella sp. s51228]|uniref:thiamine pyrophosphate-dependent enzyme n=1 Tax=Salmonella sp. s51228 TaxID=3159652 RepID=UPI003981289E
EIQAVRNEKDPIKLIISYMKEHNLIDDEEISEIETNIKDRVEDAVNYAISSSQPDLIEVYSNVYSTPYTVRGPENGQLFLVQQ